MRHHPRPFVVEVKRGTSRQSFQSHSSDSEKFSAAEKLLFSKARIEPVVSTAAPQAQSGRVLPVLADASDIVLAEPFPAPRRGRPPGSKNKVKRIDEVRLVKAPVLSKPAALPDVAGVAPETIGDRRDGQTLREHNVFVTPVLLEATVTPPNEASRSTRLRDRSRILRRYVLGTEPRAGERTSFRKRKKRNLDR